MKNSMCFQKYLGLGLSLGLFLSACTKGGQSTSQSNPASPSAPHLPSQPGSPTNGGSGGTPVTAGTGDVGGGNGLNGRVLESYRVDVTELEAYKQFLAPKWKLKEDPNSTDHTRQFMNHKTWYIAPVKFRPIDNKVLGLSFTEDQTEQLAVQTQGEVWINKESFDKMPVQEQADLIAHEIMMAIYLLKFESSVDLCHIIGFDSVVNCEQFAKNPPFNLPPEPVRKLNEKDYQNIRNATAWILNEPAPIDNEAQSRKLAALDFDKRFFARVESGPKFNKNLDRDLTVAEIMRLIQQGYEKGLFQSKCDSNFGQGAANIPCTFRSQISHIPDSTDSELSWQLSVGNELTGSIRFQSSSTPNGRFSSSSNGDTSMTELIQLENIYEIQRNKPMQAGQKRPTVLALIRKSTPYQVLNVEILGIFIAEKVYHGSQEVVSPEGTKFNCESDSFTLNDTGQANYIFVKSKKFVDSDLGYVLQYGFMDYNCDSYTNAKK